MIFEEMITSKEYNKVNIPAMKKTAHYISMKHAESNVMLNTSFRKEVIFL